MKDAFRHYRRILEESSTTVLGGILGETFKEIVLMDKVRHLFLYYLIIYAPIFILLKTIEWSAFFLFLIFVFLLDISTKRFFGRFFNKSW